MAMQSLQGHLLIAREDMDDPNFARTVVFMLQHSEHGALGVILNQPTDTAIADAWEQISDVPCNAIGLIHVGGPCQGPLMLLHVHPDRSQIDVMPGVHVATDEGDVQWLIEHSAAPTRFFVGYAGWEGGQLENEIAQGGWYSIPASIDHIFHAQGDLWEQLIEHVQLEKRYEGLPKKLIPRNPSDN
jgi:putative transcriptional regulator